MTEKRRDRRPPRISFPPELPITRHRDEILGECRDNRIVIVAGETGSGKTTQLPKMLLELGHGVDGRIGVTQPRRLAATSVAARVAEELGDRSRKAVGYQVRFDNRTGPETMVKFMTDGILLTETQSDRYLRQYDALIIDEVHERSLNIDFLLGYLKRLVPKRSDLRLVISSATLDVERFSEFFGGAPVIEVPGRTYPVEVLYREPEEKDSDPARDVAAVVEELTVLEPDSDVLVFLTGERDIRETTDVLKGRKLENTEVIPLYARLPAARQRQAFRVGGRRRIVLATNVAETSVTIPGIRAVIDSGLARIKRYNPRTQVEKLHIEPVSQASSDQRKGRCGRVGPGLCFRLFGEADFEKRKEYTDPEIKRSSLAGVILTMLNLRLGRVERFPFLDPPSSSAVKDGYRELTELGAIDEHRRLTKLGRKLARISLEPRLGRIVLEGHRNGVLSDILTIVAALSTDDPRLRPVGQEEEADAAHAAYATETSDFSSILRLWRSLRKARKEHLSRSRFRAYCRERYLSVRRIREWESVREQLKEECRQLGIRARPSHANEEKLHRSLLAGLLNKVGLKHERSGYRGARSVNFFIHPGSDLAGKGPEWLVAAELVETSRLFGRYVAAVDPEWIESLARHICRYRHGPPYWDETTGFVRAEETVLLYGLPIVEGRRRHFGPVNPEKSREIFIQHALVLGEIHAPPPVIRRNLEAMARVRSREARIRKRDIMITDSELFDFYDGKLPPNVYSTRDLKNWLKRDKRAGSLLALTEDDLMARQPGEITVSDYPDHLEFGGHRLALAYRFQAGGEDDGITCTLSPSALQDVPGHVFEWLVPGMLSDKIQAMLKGLPKSQRRPLVPVKRTVGEMLTELTPYEEPLKAAIARWVLKRKGHHLRAADWPVDLPAHMSMRFEVRDDRGRVLRTGRDLAELRAAVEKRIAPRVVRKEKKTGGREGLTEWNFGPLPESVDMGSQGWKVLRYPGLVDDGDSVSIRFFDTKYEARCATTGGLVRLTMLALPKDMKSLRSLPALPDLVPVTLRMLGAGEEDIRGDVIRRAITEACRFAAEPVRDADSFVERVYEGKPHFYPKARNLQDELAEWLDAVSGILARLESLQGVTYEHAVADIRSRLQRLFAPGFLVNVPWLNLRDYGRYLKGIEIRLDRLKQSPAKDIAKWEQLVPYTERYERYRTCDDAVDREQLETYHWMLEEWRVSLFAQELGTRIRVSAKRLDKQIALVEGAG